jgi:hypothetical protein
MYQTEKWHGETADNSRSPSLRPMSDHARTVFDCRKMNPISRKFANTYLNAKLSQHHVSYDIIGLALLLQYD